jgi:hypothetical protein
MDMQALEEQVSKLKERVFLLENLRERIVAVENVRGRLEEVEKKIVIWGSAGSLILAVLGIFGVEKLSSIPRVVSEVVTNQVEAEVQKRVGPEVMVEIQKNRDQVAGDRLLADAALRSIDTNSVVDLVRLLQRVRVTQQGELLVCANTNFGSAGCATTIQYGWGTNLRNFVFNRDGSVVDYPGIAGDNKNKPRRINPQSLTP